MKKIVHSSLNRLRVLAFLEGISLLILVFVSLPLKYMFGITTISAIVGPVHGILFILFVVNTINVGTEYHWKFKQTTWKVLLACVIPFGTFYIDRKILKKL